MHLQRAEGKRVFLVFLLLVPFCYFVFNSGNDGTLESVRYPTFGEPKWIYPARQMDVDNLYKRCTAIIPPKELWWNETRIVDGVRRLPLVQINDRRELGCLLELFELKTGAELGVQKGEFAKLVLERWPSCEKYLLVDMWRHDTTYDDGSNVNDREAEEYFRVTQENLAPWAHKTGYYRMTTTEAAAKVPDNSLDFIYVDARHDYCGTREDLHTWWPKLKMGGILAGHDYMDGNEAAAKGNSWRHCQADGTETGGAVKGAVNEFVFANGLHALATLDESTWYKTFYMQKI